MKNDICWCKKLIKTTRDKRSGGYVAISQTFVRSIYLQNLKYSIRKRACIFNFILVSILSIILILSVKEQGMVWCGVVCVYVCVDWRGRLLNRQNLLSVTKVICQQPLKAWQKLFVNGWPLMMMAVFLLCIVHIYFCFVLYIV